MIKKTFIILCFMASIVSIFAQKSAVDYTAIQRNQVRAVKDYLDDGNRTSGKNVSKSVTFNAFHSSLNGYTLLSGRKMTADPETNTSFYIARGGGSFGLTGNDIVVKFTENFGNSFDSVVYPGSEEQGNRYPGGCVFKDGNDSYVIGCGPITKDTTGWVGNYLFSKRLDGTQSADTVFAEPEDGSHFYRYPNEPYVLPTGELFILTEKMFYKEDTLYKNNEYSIFKFHWNATAKKFNYVSETLITPPADTAGMPPAQPFGMAFSTDGSVGYFWVNTQVDTNADNRYNLQTQPMVYYTDDKGENWNPLPLYDFSSNTNLTDKLRPIRRTIYETDPENYIYRPTFSYGYTSSEENMPGIVVDDKLFLMATIGSGYSDHKDSLTYFYSAEPTMFFMVTVTTFGEWDVIYVDTLKSKVVEANPTAKTFFMDHRSHLSKIESENESLVFALWTDTEEGIDSYNKFPDVYGKAFRFTEDFENVEISRSHNFTVNTGYGAAAVYMNVSDIALIDSVNSFYQIPVVCTDLTNSESPVMHEYYKGIVFPFDLKTVNVKENLSSVEINLYPNPATSHATLILNSSKNTEAKIQIVNMLGQNIYSQHTVLNTGNNQKTIDISNLKSGFYLVNIQVENSIQTKKLIVK